MNRVLLLGYSKIAQKAIIPAIKKSSTIQLTSIASKSKFSTIPNEFQVFNDYQEAINKSNCDTVYVSLNNSDHFQWIQYALKMGKNVIVDKPAVLGGKQALDCYNLAGGKQVIFEAIPYLYHEQHQLLQSKLLKRKTIQVITVNFGFPPINLGDFRYQSEDLGGGCIWDIGPYAVSAGEFYFKNRPRKVYCKALVKNKTPLVAAITLEYGDDQILQAVVGFQFEYRNHLEVWGEDFHYWLDRSFTIPTDFQNIIHYKSKDQSESISVKESDAFLQMLKEYSKITSNGDFKNLNRSFLDHATILEAINKSHQTGKPQRIKYYEQ